MFKTTIFGGFNKEEVLEHIKISEQRRQEEVEQMRLRISMLEEQLAAANQQEADWQEQISSLRASLEARQLKYEQAGKELADLCRQYFVPDNDGSEE